MNNLEPRESSWKVEILSNHSSLVDPMKPVVEAYIKRRKEVAYDLSMNKASDYVFTYTAMHGVGHKYMEMVFECLQLKVSYLLACLMLSNLN